MYGAIAEAVPWASCPVQYLYFPLRRMFGLDLSKSTLTAPKMAVLEANRIRMG